MVVRDDGFMLVLVKRSVVSECLRSFLINLRDSFFRRIATTCHCKQRSVYI